MELAHYAGALSLLGEVNRLRLCALLSRSELCVTDLVRATGIAQSRVSTHLGRLRAAGLVRDRRQGTQCFYALAGDEVPRPLRALVDDALRSPDPVLSADRRRLDELFAERGGAPSGLGDDLERDYSPGRTWKSLALGTAALLKLGDVLDVGCGDGAAAATVAPFCRSLTCVDENARMIEAVRARLGELAHVRAEVADAHDLPFSAASFDAVLLFHTLAYAARPPRAIAECARVLRPGGRLAVLCLDRHEDGVVAPRHGERHPGFSPRDVRRLLARAGLSVVSSAVACRDPRRPSLRVVLAIADKAKPHAQPRKK